jgi:hypothetical protein
MPQFARPSADTVIGAWEDDDEGVTDIFECIDEEVPDDEDYITSEDAPDSSAYVTKLTEVEDPVIHTGHKVRYRIQKSSAGGSQIDCTVELREGYVSEQEQGTLIATETIEDVPHEWTTHTLTLTEEEAALITDYTDLYLRFVADQVLV